MVNKELKFPVVHQNNTVVGYGGNQEWFSQNMRRRAGCGCTSGANLAAYYALNHPEMAGIYNGDTNKFDQSEYVQAMDEMYNYMKPGFLGYPYIKKFGKQFIKFCKDHGVTAEVQFCNKFRNADEACTFVKESIDADHPVALLILFHRAHSLREDNWHWVTITGYIEDENDPEESEIILSNCGERQIVIARQLFEVHRKNTIRMVGFRII